MRNLFRYTLLAFLLGHTGIAQPAPLTADQDHAQLLHVLGIENLRRGADGNADSPFAANTDETKANAALTSLPPLLQSVGGRPLASATDWEANRPALLNTFSQEIYGYVPGAAPELHWQAGSTTPLANSGAAAVRQRFTATLVHPENAALNLSLNFTLVLPKSNKPVPVVVVMSFDPGIWERFRDRMPAERYAQIQADNARWRKQVVNAGWGYAEIIPTEFQADSGDGLSQGIIGFVNNGKPRNPTDWGALRAWAWSASQVLTYLQTDSRVAANKISVHGHSRFGKAALVAMAFDSRFAAGFISSSGEGGAKLWRRNFGEQIGNIAGAGEYHWMAGNFVKYAGPQTVSDLPVDAHQLLALCAPRPVLVSVGSQGESWVDPKGMLLAAYHATPAYALFGEKGVTQNELPPVGNGLLAGKLAFRQHEGGHTPAPNWKTFINFASRQWASPNKHK
ncbi:hypothetical protein [Teredinibacter turnerae]|uniref:glucuronyl esterase domain-containing protein n=1 Tax=Teredinibacter turnerae TaxID=2426 RepID=UPI000367ED48|nr:hypothetical protein [Teredinibacter turnerae]